MRVPAGSGEDESPAADGTEARYIREYLDENPRHLHAAFAAARGWPAVLSMGIEASTASPIGSKRYLETLSGSEIGTLLAERSGNDGIERIGDFDEWYGSPRGESLRPVRMVLVGLGLDASAHRWCPTWRTGLSTSNW